MCYVRSVITWTSLDAEECFACALDTGWPVWSTDCRHRQSQVDVILMSSPTHQPPCTPSTNQPLPSTHHLCTSLGTSELQQHRPATGANLMQFWVVPWKAQMTTGAQHFADPSVTPQRYQGCQQYHQGPGDAIKATADSVLLMTNCPWYSTHTLTSCRLLPQSVPCAMPLLE